MGARSVKDRKRLRVVLLATISATLAAAIFAAKSAHLSHVIFSPLEHVLVLISTAQFIFLMRLKRGATDASQAAPASARSASGSRDKIIKGVIGALCVLVGIFLLLYLWDNENGWRYGLGAILS